MKRKNRQIKYNEENYIKKNYMVNGKAVIPVDLENVDDLFMKHDFKKYEMSDDVCKYIEEIAKEPKFLENYRSALSTGTAILAMLVTNFAIDAPLTVKMTNKLKKKFVEGKEQSLNVKEVRNG